MQEAQPQPPAAPVTLDVPPISPGKYDLTEPDVFAPREDTKAPGTSLIVLSNSITLDQALADRLNALVRNETEARLALSRVACDVRRQYLSENGTKYAPEFTSFWTKFQMEKTFGKLPQFTKYALAGDLLQRVERRHPQHAPSLPGNVKPLYALSQLSDEELGEFLETQAASIASPDGQAPPDTSQKAPTPTGAPITEAKVNAWRKARRAPEPLTTELPFLRLVEIMVHGSFGALMRIPTKAATDSNLIAATIPI